MAYKIRQTLVKSALTIVALMLILAVSSSGQDRSRIETAWKRLGIDPDTLPEFEVVHQHIDGELPGFRVAIDFHELPQPLQVARATVTLTADADLLPSIAHDWQLCFGVSERRVKWLSDKFFDIPGQIDAGDAYTIPIEFIVLESGQFGFTMYWTNFPVTVQNLPIEWCLGKDGELTYLGNATRFRPCCVDERVTYFDKDSVRIVDNLRALVGHDMFTGDCKIVPPFKIGEPSSVCFRIQFVKDHPNGVDLEFSYGHMEVRDYPETLNGPLYAGESIELCVTAVPLPNREKHEIALTVYDSNVIPPDEAMLLTFVFSDDGTLRYIQQGDLGDLALRGNKEEYLPKSFPEGTKATCGSHWIKRN